MVEQHTSDTIVSSAYHVLFHQLDDSAIILDNQQTIIMSNPPALQLFSIAADNLHGMTVSKLIKQTFDLNVSLDELPATLLTKTINKDETYYYKANVKSLPDNQGNLVIFADVTELTILKQEYSEFAHTLGHDVKAPLGVAVGYSNILQGELDKDTEHRFFVDEIFNTTMRIMNICNELVLLSDLERLNSTENMPVDMRFVTENAMRRFQHVTDTRTVNLTIADKLPYVSGNAPWVEEAIVDYLHYAMVRNPSARQIDIDISLTDDQTVQFSVHHDGTNVPVTTVDEMFSDDINLATVRAEGYGLGLNVAKRLVELMGGRVAVINGDTLTFSLDTIPPK